MKKTSQQLNEKEDSLFYHISRARTPFEFFKKKNFAKFKAVDPKLPLLDVNKSLKVAWRNLAEAEKTEFYQQSKEDYKRYKDARIELEKNGKIYKPIKKEDPNMYAHTIFKKDAVKKIKKQFPHHTGEEVDEVISLI
jgi:hypothetical protein